jgi:hypothetical protein
LLTEAKRGLNQGVWNGTKLDPFVRNRLLKIVDDFIADLNLAKSVKPSDIQLTGSMANYNWRNDSDLDVHIVLDFKKIDCDRKIATEYLHDEASLWNEHHSINLRGHEVEVYVQDVTETVYAGGTYSLLKGEWVKFPKHIKMPNKVEVKKKAIVIAKQIDRLSAALKKGDAGTVHKKLEAIRKRIKNMRKRALAASGEGAVDNHVFKYLRQSGHMKKLVDSAREAYDKSMTVHEAVIDCKSFLLTE